MLPRERCSRSAGTTRRRPLDRRRRRADCGRASVWRDGSETTGEAGRSAAETVVLGMDLNFKAFVACAEAQFSGSRRHELMTLIETWEGILPQHAAWTRGQYSVRIDVIGPNGSAVQVSTDGDLNCRGNQDDKRVPFTLEGARDIGDIIVARLFDPRAEE